MSPFKIIPSFGWCKLMSLLYFSSPRGLHCRFYQPNLGKSCLIIFLNLVPLIFSYLSKACQFNFMVVSPLDANH
jgi:hypothetical protein